MYTAFAPMLPVSVKPSDELIKDFYATLSQQSQLYLDHDGNFRRAFQTVRLGCVSNSEACVL